MSNEEIRNTRSLEYLYKTLSICPAPQGMVEIVASATEEGKVGWVSRVFALALTTDGKYEYVYPVIDINDGLDVDDCVEQCVAYDILLPPMTEEELLEKWKAEINLKHEKLLKRRNKK